LFIAQRKNIEMKTEIAEKVASILEKSIDAEKGFKTAFENAIERSLKNYFFEKAKQRSSFINELELEISRTTGTTGDISGSITGDLHRTWMDFKSLVSSNNDEAMLEEAIRGEKAAKEEFENILDEEYLTLEIRNILSKQLEIIKHDLESITTLADIQTNFY
jgi:uncharacterized protein (TIGR02284 family)